MIPTINYDEQVASYGRNLTETLRNFGTKHDFLDMWVHDPDDTMSLLSMIESAESARLGTLKVVLSKDTFPKIEIDRLTQMTKDFATVTVENTDPTPQLNIRFLKWNI